MHALNVYLGGRDKSRQMCHLEMRGRVPEQSVGGERVGLMGCRSQKLASQWLALSARLWEQGDLSASLLVKAQKSLGSGTPAISDSRQQAGLWERDQRCRNIRACSVTVLYFLQLLDHSHHLHNVGTLNPYSGNCDHRSQKFIHVAHKIRDEETALCMQIETACIPEYNDGGKKREFPDVLTSDFQDVQSLGNAFWWIFQRWNMPLIKEGFFPLYDKSCVHGGTHLVRMSYAKWKDKTFTLIYDHGY